MEMPAKSGSMADEEFFELYDFFDKTTSYSRSWSLVRTFGIALGVTFFFAAIVAGNFYTKEVLECPTCGRIYNTTYPYGEYTFPLAIIGILFFVVGFVGHKRMWRQKMSGGPEGI